MHRRFHMEVHLAAPVGHTSRVARALPLYAALRALGRSGVVELVERSCAHARLLARLLAADPAIEVVNEVVLNQVLLRVADAELVARRVQREGVCWLGTTTWNGQQLLRASVCNWSTREDDIRQSAAAIRRATRPFG